MNEMIMFTLFFRKEGLFSVREGERRRDQSFEPDTYSDNIEFKYRAYRM